MKLQIISFVIALLLGCVMNVEFEVAQATPRAESDHVAEPGRRIVMTGRTTAQLAPLDRLMTRFMAEHDVPGASLAVTRKGRLVYARGFGYADRQTKQPAQPTSLFRIASISKPITSAAIMQLVESKQLQLSDKVVDLLQIQPRLEKGAHADPRLKRVTILHLLQHTGGWDRSVSPDPMFQSVRIAKALQVDPPARQEHIICYTLGQPLDFDPGSRYAYCNFGYCLLGRVIEKVTGLSYQAYVEKHLLEPLKIEGMLLGKTFLDDRAAGEVTYYDRQQRIKRSVFSTKSQALVPLPYGAWCLEAMDSHGGWIASAVHLVRFASALDQPATGGILGPVGSQLMFSPPAGQVGLEANGKPKTVFYACGWMVRQWTQDNHLRRDTWHMGALDGTSTLLVRRSDQMNWAVLFNARYDKNQKYLAATIDSQVHKAVDAVRVWPKQDLFPALLGAGNGQ